jgi:hypothetical protein
MKRQLIVPGIVALLVLVVLGGCRPADGPLVYRFQPGTAYVYADTTRVNQAQEMMGQEMKITSLNTARSRMVGESVNADGSLVLVTSLDSMVIDTKSAMKDTVMVMADLLGKRTRIIVSPGGSVLKRETIDSLNLGGRQMRGMAMRESARFHRLSPKPVGVDSTWKGETVDSTEMMGGKMINRTNLDYTVLGTTVYEGRSCLEIGYKGDIAVEGKGAMMGMELFLEGKGKTSGTFIFDPVQGLSVKENSSTDTEMTAAVTGQQSMTIPMSTSTTTTRRLISIEGGKK